MSAAPEFRTARALAFYAELPDEVPLRELFERAGRDALRLFPRCGSGAALEFAAVARWEELVPGRYGVLQPPAEREALVLSSEDLVFLPGVAFDGEGRRLGRGEGWYDRTFPPRAPTAPTLFGVAAAFQLVDEVPSGAGDRAVDAVATERGLRRARGGSR